MQTGVSVLVVAKCVMIGVFVRSQGKMVNCSTFVDARLLVYTGLEPGIREGLLAATRHKVIKPQTTTATHKVI